MARPCTCARNAPGTSETSWRLTMAKPTQNTELLDQPARRLEGSFAKPSGGPLAARSDDSVVVSERTLFGDVVMAQPTKAPRDEARVLQRIKTMAAAAGEAWYYRFP